MRAGWLASAAALVAACSSGEPFSAGSGGTGSGGSAGTAGEVSPPKGGQAGTSTSGGASGGDGAEAGSANEAGAEATASGGEGGAVSLQCPAGFDDCNEKPGDGCETPLDTAQNCGACERACQATTAPFCAKQGATHACTNPIAELSAQRIELPCAADVSSPSLCGSVPTAEGPACAKTGKVVMRELKVGGAPGVVYDVTLRIRGVVEPKIYTGGTDAGDHFYLGGEPTVTNYNAFSMQVSAPAQKYFFNGADATGEHGVFKLDHTKVVAVAGGATLRLAVSDPDCAMVRNCQSTEGACTPYVVDGIAPAPAAFYGQFIQIDVVKVVPAKGP